MQSQKDLQKRLNGVASWSRQQLVTEYISIYKQPPIHRCSEAMLRRMIAYDWQVKVYGGLSRADQKLLSRLLSNYKRNPKSIWEQVLQIKPGAKVRRVWKGKMHEAVASESGFVYQGQNYGSLSEIANLITGTRWNGHVFFGLKQVKRDTVHEAA